MEFKVCADCKKKKPLSCFYVTRKSKKTAIARACWTCKTCFNK
jgi:hypothetical protein